MASIHERFEALEIRLNEFKAVIDDIDSMRENLPDPRPVQTPIPTSIVADGQLADRVDQIRLNSETLANKFDEIESRLRLLGQK